MPEIIHIAIAVLCILTFVKVIGYVLVKVFIKNNPVNNSVFLQAATGISFIAMGYAVYCTRLHTLYMPSFFLLLALFIYRSINSIKHLNFKDAFTGLSELLLASLIFTLPFIFFYNPFSSKIYVIGHDYAYYSYLSYYLSYYGIENASGIFNFQDYYAQINKIYHYLELWLIAFVADTFKLHNFVVAHAFMAITAMTLVYIFVAECLKNINIYQKVLLLLIIPTTFFVLPFFKNIPFLNSTYNLGNQSFWIFPKYFFILLTILAYVKLHEAKMKYDVVIFLFLPFAHTGTTFLGAFILLMLFLVEIFMGNVSGLLRKILVFIFPRYIVDNSLSLNNYKIKLFNLKISDKALVTAITLAVYVTISFALLKHYSAKDKYTENIFNLSEVFSFSYLILLIKIITKTIIDSFLVTIPFTLVLFIFKKQISKFYTAMPFYLIVIFLFSGLVSYAVFNYVTNEAAQFYYYVFFTVMPVFLIYALMNLWVNTKPNNLLLVMLLFFLGYSVYSFYFSQLSFNSNFVEKSFLKNIKYSFEKNNATHRPGAVFYNNNFVNPRLLRITQGYELLGMAHPALFYIRFSQLPDISSLSPILKRDIMAFEKMTYPYSVYCRLNNIEKDYTPQSVMAAMKHYRVNWLVEDKNSYLPDYLKPYVSSTVVDSVNNAKVHFISW